MCEVPVFYATSEGQTRRVAARIAEELRSHGLQSDAIDITGDDATRVDWSRVRGVLLGASIHAGHHQSSAVKFACVIRDRLNAVPSAFFSVSLAAASSKPTEVAEAERLARAFPEQAGWHPTRVVCVAGRLAYTSYGFFTRWIMRRIARKEGGPTDTTRDYELTDWAAVSRFASEMATTIARALYSTASSTGRRGV